MASVCPLVCGTGCGWRSHDQDAKDADAGLQYVSDTAALCQPDSPAHLRSVSKSSAVGHPRSTSKSSIGALVKEKLASSGSNGKAESRRKFASNASNGSKGSRSSKVSKSGRRSRRASHHDYELSETLQEQLGLSQPGRASSKSQLGFGDEPESADDRNKPKPPGVHRREQSMATVMALKAKMKAFRRSMVVVPKPTEVERARGVQIEGVYDFWTFEDQETRQRKMGKDVFHDRAKNHIDEPEQESTSDSSSSEDSDSEDSSGADSPRSARKSPRSRLPPRNEKGLSPRHDTHGMSPRRQSVMQRPSAADFKSNPRNCEAFTNWSTIVGKMLNSKMLDFTSLLDKAAAQSHKQKFLASSAAKGTILNSVRERARVVARRAYEISKRIVKEKSDRYDSEWDEPDLLVQLFSTEYFDTLALFANTARKILSVQPSLVTVPVPCRIFGDIHGQFRDMLLLFHAFGGPDERNAPMFVFNGDFVDRGDHQLEVIGLLLALKVLLPERVWLIRGNHEDRHMNKRYGFMEQCHRRLGSKLGPKIFDIIQNTFDMLPVACLIADRVLVVHGGIGDGAWKVGDIRRIKRPLMGEALGEQWISDLLWSDPIEDDDKNLDGVFGVHDSPRGGSTARFGWNVSKSFCARNGLSLIVRSHQSKRGSPGFDIMHESLLMRVFSARDYEGHGNDGAVLLLTSASHDGHEVLLVRPQVVRSTDKAKSELMARAKTDTPRQAPAAAKPPNKSPRDQGKSRQKAKAKTSPRGVFKLSPRGQAKTVP